MPLVTNLESGLAHIPTWATWVSADSRRRIAADTDQILAAGQFRHGAFTGRLEDRLSEDFGRPAVAVASGMAALGLLLQAVGVSGRRVLLPANCFQNIPALVAQLGGRPIPVDVEAATMSVAGAVAPATGTNVERPIVLWVHHAGMVHAEAAAEIAQLRATGCFVIEDCAYALPMVGDPVSPGCWGDAAIFSFAPTKATPGSGGGAVMVRDGALAAEIAARRFHGGQESRWQSGEQFVHNQDIEEFQASVAYHQWCTRAERIDRLAEVAAAYRWALDEVGSTLLPPGRDWQPTWTKFIVDLPAPAPAVQERMGDAHAIRTTLMYERPWFDYLALERFTPNGNWSRVRQLCHRSLCLPYFATLDARAVKRVVVALVASIESARSVECP
jgi:dTDP-4-amino-4,6-dideoxygalactose transaminase